GLRKRGSQSGWICMATRFQHRSESLRADSTFLQHSPLRTHPDASGPPARFPNSGAPQLGGGGDLSPGLRLEKPGHLMICPANWGFDPLAPMIGTLSAASWCGDKCNAETNAMRRQMSRIALPQIHARAPAEIGASINGIENMMK